MAPTVIPRDKDDLEEIVCEAANHKEPLTLSGSGSRSFLGRRIEEDKVVDLSALDELVSYEPDELILIAQPGMKLTAIENLLDKHNQHLAFEPPHWSNSATLGGTIACGLSGPRRFKSGAVRDFVLGIEFIDGRGDRAKAGGRVVKNVTGYDLPRALTGSYGTLAILTEVCLKLWPRSSSERTVIIQGLSIDVAAQTLSNWARTTYEFTGLAYVPSAHGHSTVARIEGSEKAVNQQANDVIKPFADAEILPTNESRRFWYDIRELRCITPKTNEELWRFSIPQTKMADLAAQLTPLGLVRYAVDAAGAIFWGIMPANIVPASLHALAKTNDGEAWRFGTGDDDDNAHAFTPLAPALMKANQALKKALDPYSILNRGRMYPEL